MSFSAWQLQALEVCQDGIFEKTWGGCNAPCSTVGIKVNGADVDLATAAASVEDATAVELDYY